MEPPNSWNRLTASLAVCDLRRANQAWAFLVLQELVRDAAGDREDFLTVVEQEREREITGPSAALRIADELQRRGIALPASLAPDPEAVTASRRFAIVREWTTAEASAATAEGVAKSAAAPPEASAEAKPESETWWTDVRAFRLFGISNNPKEVAQRTADLWHVLRSVIQDVAVLQAMMQEKGVWDAAKYRELRQQQMVKDHSGSGASPWTDCSYYPYTLNETDFLKHQFDATDAEVKEFEKRVESQERQS